MHHPPKVLIVKIGAIGDVIFALPAVAALKRAVPGVRVEWLVGRACAPLLERNTALDRVIVVNDKALFGAGLVQRIAAAAQMRARMGRYDAVLIAHRNAAYALAFAGSGSLFQLARSEADKAVPRVNSTVVPPGTLHESLAIQRLVNDALRSAFGKEPQTEWTWDIDYLKAPAPEQTVLRAQYVCLHIGGGQNAGVEFTLKQWPHWQQLVEKLLLVTDGGVVLVGSGADQEAGDRLVDAAPSAVRRRVVNLAGKTDLGQLATVVSGAEFLVGCDSGPLHLADAFGVPCVGLYGATSTVTWGLLGRRSLALSQGVPCSPCYRDNGIFPACPYSVRCMSELTVNTVRDAVHSMLDGGMPAVQPTSG